MAIQQIGLESLQFTPGEDPAPKLRRLQEQIRSLQQSLNAAIAELNDAYVTKTAADGEVPALADGEWDLTVVAGSPPTFQIRYNDGGTLRTGTIALS